MWHNKESDSLLCDTGKSRTPCWLTQQRVGLLAVLYSEESDSLLYNTTKSRTPCSMTLQRVGLLAVLYSEESDSLPYDTVKSRTPYCVIQWRVGLLAVWFSVEFIIIFNNEPPVLIQHSVTIITKIHPRRKRIYIMNCLSCYSGAKKWLLSKKMAKTLVKLPLYSPEINAN